MIAVSNLAASTGIALGLIFVIAGAAKIAAGPKWPAQAADLGVPKVVALAVPWIEIAVGVTLATRLGAPIPAIVAIAMLLAFTALLIVRLRAGERPPCACFGNWYSAPLSGWDIARNVAMLVLAVLTFFT